MSDLRVYDGPDGRYIHAGDLAARLRQWAAEPTTSPIHAVSLPVAAQVVEIIASSEGVERVPHA